MDLKAMAEKVELEEEEYQELIELFLMTTSQHLFDLQGAIAQRDGRKVAETAHSIKGSAASLGLTEISGIAKGIEASAREGNLHEVERGFLAIKKEMGQIALWVSNLR